MTELTAENLQAAKELYTRLYDVIESSKAELFHYDRDMLIWMKNKAQDRIVEINEINKREFEAEDF